MYAATPIIDSSCKYQSVPGLPMNLVLSWNEPMLNLRMPRIAQVELSAAQEIMYSIGEPASSEAAKEEEVMKWIGEAASSGSESESEDEQRPGPKRAREVEEEEEEEDEVVILEWELRHNAQEDNYEVTDLTITHVTNLDKELAKRLMECFPNVETLRIQVESLDESSWMFFEPLKKAKVIYVDPVAPKTKVRLRALVALCPAREKRSQRYVHKLHNRGHAKRR